MSASTRKKVQRKCKIRGYSLKVDALDEILSFVSRFSYSDADDAIDLLLDQLHNQACNNQPIVHYQLFSSFHFTLTQLSLFSSFVAVKSPIIEKDAVHAVVTLLSEAKAAVDDDTPNAATTTSSIRVVDAFLIPNLRYDPIKKLFYE